jgi:hypothetical protein
MHYRTVEEAYKRFNAWVENPEANPIPPPLRVAVWRSAVEKDPARAVDILKKEWFTTKSVDGKLFALSVLGSVKDTEILQNNIIPFNYNTEPPSNAVPSADVHVLGGSLSTNYVARPLQWQYLQKNWDAVVAKIANPIVLDRLINVSLSRFTDESAVTEIAAFFEDKDTSSFNRTLQTVQDKIRGRAAYKKRDAALLKEWLNTNGYN